MTELSPDLKKLVHSARDALSPTPEQVAAVRNALEARLGPTPSAGNGGVGGAVPGGFSALHAIGIGFIALSFFAGAAVLYVQGHAPARALPSQAQAHARTVAPVQPDAAPSEPEALPSAPGAIRMKTRAELATVEPRRSTRGSRHRHKLVRVRAEAQPLAADGRASAATSSARAAADSEPTREAQLDQTARPIEPQPETAAQDALQPAAAPQDDALAREIDLIARARDALTHGHPARALDLAEQHAQRFPRGHLRQEQLAVRVLALCALGRNRDARSVLDELEHFARRSPHLMSIAAHCPEQVVAPAVP